MRVGNRLGILLCLITGQAVLLMRFRKTHIQFVNIRLTTFDPTVWAVDHPLAWKRLIVHSNR